MIRLLAAATVAALPIAAAAQTPGAVTYGPGHKLCSDWSAAEVKPDDHDYMANRFFVAGVMSAYNLYVSPPGYDVGKGLKPEDMKAFMHDRCAGHPTETIGAAAVAWIDHLKARAQP